VRRSSRGTGASLVAAAKPRSVRRTTAPDRPALGVVAVQQRRSGHVANHVRKLPAQVDRVLDAGVHALGADRAVHVGGVAGQE